MVVASKIEANELKARASGRWLEIFSVIAKELDEAASRLGRHVACPMHDSPDGFRLFHDAAETGGGVCSTCGIFHDGFALLRELRGWSFPEVLVEVAGALGGTATAIERRPRPKALPTPKDRDARVGLNRLWKAGRSDSEAMQLVADYLATRGLDPALAELWMSEARVHPALPYRNDEGKVVGEWPCVLTMVRAADGKPVTLHRTWLNRVDGETVFKAPVSHPKKLYPVPDGSSVTGGAIRFGEPIGTTLGIAEGIETALAVTGATGMTVWGCWSASLLPGFAPPEGVDAVVIWADRDRPRRRPPLPSGEERPPSHPGLDAARALQKRLWEEGVKAAVQLPQVEIPAGKSSVDWADVFAFEQRRRPRSMQI